MIVTVTANTGIDTIYFIPAWEAGKTLRASDAVVGMSGKPINCSWVLAEMGINSLALGFAAGPTGALVEAMAREQGITTDFVKVEGESRKNLVIAVADGTPHTSITASLLVVRPEHVAALRAKYIAALDDCELVVLGGTLPKGMTPDYYTDMIALARARNIPVIFDAVEPNLSAGLISRPTYVKPNRDELSQFIGRSVETIEEAYDAGRELLHRHGTIPIISLGEEGGLAVLPERAYRILPLHVPVVNAAGAGDAVLAGLSAMVVRGLSIEDGLRLGFGAATAVVTTPATAECNLADIERYAAEIEVLPYERV